MAERIYVSRTRRYHWPEVQLNLWILIVLAAAATCLGIFAWFMVVQEQLKVGIPWLFPFMVTSASLAILFLALILILAAQRSLIPGIIILGSFILFVLWLTGLIETAIQLYGPAGNVNGNCASFVDGEKNTFRGQSVGALAWLTQENICNCWKAAFAFEVVGAVFFLWMMVMAYQVTQNTYD